MPKHSTNTAFSGYYAKLKVKSSMVHWDK